MPALRRPGRTFLTALGTILGVGAVVAVLGVAGTARQQISDRFDAALSTQVSVSDLAQGTIAISTERSVLELSGVRAAGISWRVSPSVPVSTNPDPARADDSSTPLPIYAATPNGLAVLGAQVLDGRLFDAGHEARHDHVALVGAIAARTLGLTSTVNQPAILIDGTLFTVIGIVGGLEREAGALSGVVLPATTAADLTRPGPATGRSATAGSGGAGRDQPQLFVTTAPGAAQVVGSEIVFAVAPQDVAALSVATPPDPRTLRNAVQGTTATLVLLLAGLALAVGVVAIANSTLLAVLERVPEIGLRRALGARPSHIGVVTLIEAAIVGAVGGILGAAVGVFVTTGVALSQSWSAVLDPRVALLAPLVGTAAGLLAGIYPAWRATRIEPVAALQR